MNDQKTLDEILEVQKKQLSVLDDLLKEQERNNSVYREYLEDGRRRNEQWSALNQESADALARREEERLREHEEYIESQVVLRRSNYVRMLTSVSIFGLAIYFIWFR